MKTVQNDKFNCSNAKVYEGRLGFYIIADDTNYLFYVHNDGNVYDGATPVATGWFESQEAAQKVLDEAKSVFCAKNERGK